MKLKIKNSHNCVIINKRNVRKEMKDYIIVDDMNRETNPTPRIVLDSDGNPLTVELMLFTYSKYQMSDILDTSKIRNSHNSVQSTDLQDISLNGENITCFKLPSRHMFCRYNYWLAGLTGKYSLNNNINSSIMLFRFSITSVIIGYQI